MQFLNYVNISESTSLYALSGIIVHYSKQRDRTMSQVVTFNGLKPMENHTSSTKRRLGIAYKRWSFTRRGSKGFEWENF